VDETGQDRAVLRVERLRRRYPRASKDELAGRLIRRAALECASAGVLMTGPAAFFGAKPFGAGLAWQILALNRLVLALGTVYGRPLSGQDRLTGIAAGAAAGVGSEILRQGLVSLLARILPRRPGARSAAGALAGSALGYGAALAVGRFARDSFRGGLSWPRR